MAKHAVQGGIENTTRKYMSRNFFKRFTKCKQKKLSPLFLNLRLRNGDRD